MNTALMTERIAQTSPRLNVPDFRRSDCRAQEFKVPSFNAPGSRAKIAGILSLLGLLAAAFVQTLIRGSLNVRGSLVAVSAMIALTLLFYDALSPLSRRLSLLALSFNLVGLAFELLRLQIRGANIAIVFNGFYCVLIGYLVFRSIVTDRFLGALMALGGLSWLTLMSPVLTSYLSPYNLALGILGDGAVCLWVLVMGVKIRSFLNTDDEAQK